MKNVIERYFIKPVESLPKACAKWFVEKFADRLERRPASFEKILVLTPTRNAAKNFKNAVFAECLSRGIDAISQLRAGTLEDELARNGTDRDEPQSTLARAIWTDILDSRDLSEFASLFPAETPKREDFASVCRQFMFLQDALAENLLTISDAAKKLADTPDAARWNELAALEKIFAERVAKRGKTPHAKSLKNAVERTANAGWETIVVAGNPDVSPTLKSLLDTFAGRSLIAVVGENENLFDPYGAPKTPEYRDKNTALEDGAIRVYHSVAAEAQAVAELAGKYGDKVYETLAIACEQNDSADTFKTALAEAGINAVKLDAGNMAATAVGDLLDCIAAFSADASYANFLNLLRNPFALQTLAKMAEKTPEETLAAADTLKTESACADIEQARGALLARLYANSPDRDTAKFAKIKFLRGVFDFVSETLEIGGGKAAEKIGNAVAALVGDAETDERNARALEVLGETLAEISDAEKSENMEFSPEEIFGIASEHLAAATDTERLDDERLPLQDWMEIFWSPAKHLALCDMNEGIVPLASSDGIFLNDAVRIKLGMRNRQLRRARDAYMLDALAQSRAASGGAVSVCVPQTDGRGEPLAPSRILFQTPQLPARVKMLFAAVKQSDKPSKPAPEWKLRVPNKRFEGGYSHTKFAAYMKSPWEFYLSYVLKMEKVDAQKSELDAAQFGTLFHKAFFKFAKSAAADSANADEIRRALLDAFDETAIDAFGRRPRAQVRIQLENLRNRLSACAEIQAQHRAAGWRITAAEKPFATEISGEKFSGTFDRIDENESDGSLLVLDYKTYDKCRRGVARDSHLKMKTDGAIEWESLQLPLYARALREERPDAKISAAFFVAPKDTASTQVDFWDDVADFETPALEKAAEIIAAIRAGNFAPGKPPKYPAFDDVFNADAETLKNMLEFER